MEWTVREIGKDDILKVVLDKEANEVLDTLVVEYVETASGEKIYSQPTAKQTLTT